MKQLILIVSLAMNINTYAQDTDKTITLLVNGQGKTQDEAKQNALRSAIEQAFGTFISSKTEILNDNLVKDEIVSVSNGNIQKFDVISEVQIPDGGYATFLKATVSVTKLTSFVVSKGIEVEFKGSLFAFNLNQQILNESNESKAIKDMIDVTIDIISKSFYGKIQPKDPILKSGDNYTLPYEIEIYGNENINEAVKYFCNNLNKLSMSKELINDYFKLNKTIYEIILTSPNTPINGQFKYKSSSSSVCPHAEPDYNTSSCEYTSLYLRNKLSYDYIFHFLNWSYNLVFNFNIKTDSDIDLKIDKINMLECSNKSVIPLCNGLIPFSSPEITTNPSLPIIIPAGDYICNSQIDVGTINKSLAKYICSRRTSYFKSPFRVLLVHQYQKNGLIYKLSGSSNISLGDLGKISKISIEYIKTVK